MWAGVSQVVRTVQPLARSAVGGVQPAEEASRCPSGLNATPNTALSWPRSVARTRDSTMAWRSAARASGVGLTSNAWLASMMLSSGSAASWVSALATSSRENAKSRWNHTTTARTLMIASAC